MLIRTFLFGVVGLLALYFVGVPLFKLLKLWYYDITDPLESAQARHERARKEVAAAEIDKKTEQVYGKIYKTEDSSSDEDDVDWEQEAEVMYTHSSYEKAKEFAMQGEQWLQDEFRLK